MGKNYDNEVPAGEPPLGPAIDRFLDNIEDPFDRHSKSRGRYGITDVTHSFVNAFVEFCRADPHKAGHLMVYQFLASLAVLIGIIVAIWVLLS